MLLIELFAPKGALGAEQRRRIPERLIDAISEAGAPAEIIEAWRALTHVVVHEPSEWVVGGRALEPGEPPRYIVRVSVPGAWRKDMSAHAIARLTQALAEEDPHPQRLYQEPLVWVQIVGVAEGSYGAFGKVMRSTDIVKMITKPYREASAGRIPTEEPAPGTAIDPICGMTVALTDAAITLEYAGTTYAFCSSGCRSVFAEELIA
jgi:YHS domain-containing protein